MVVRQPEADDKKDRLDIKTEVVQAFGEGLKVIVLDSSQIPGVPADVKALVYRSDAHLMQVIK